VIDQNLISELKCLGEKHILHHRRLSTCPVANHNDRLLCSKQALHHVVVLNPESSWDHDVAACLHRSAKFLILLLHPNQTVAVVVTCPLTVV
jgi:hypothetical protein